jgi:hypothetical protein
MSDRWVCKRCFADNEAASAACTRCGLLRGSEVPEATDQAAWAAETGMPAPAAAEPGWRKWLRFWWIPVVVVVLAVGYFTTARRGGDGSLDAGGTLSVTDLQVGDCFSTGGETEISDVDAVPCTEPHKYEVFAVRDHDGPLPLTDASYESAFNTLCLGDFEAYVEADWTSSAIYADMITPSEESFADGDREYICFLYEPDPEDINQDLVLTESLRGAAR